MRETRLSGSVEGVMGNHDSYSDFWFRLIRWAALGQCNAVEWGMGCLASHTSSVT